MNTLPVRLYDAPQWEGRRQLMAAVLRVEAEDIMSNGVAALQEKDPAAPRHFAVSVALFALAHCLTRPLRSRQERP